MLEKLHLNYYLVIYFNTQKEAIFGINKGVTSKKINLLTIGEVLL